MPENHRASILVAAITALIVSLGSVCAYVAFEKYIRESMYDPYAMRPTRPAPRATTAPANVPTFVWPDTDEATNKDLNLRYAELETLKLDVAVAEQAKRLDTLRAEGETSSVQQVQASRVDPEVEQVIVSAPIVPPMVTTVVPELYGAEAAKVAEPKLMGVYGIDGALRASFMTPEGKRIVRQGQSLFGSKVTAITLEHVSLADGTTFYVGQ